MWLFVGGCIINHHSLTLNMLKEAYFKCFGKRDEMSYAEYDLCVVSNIQSLSGLGTTAMERTKTVVRPFNVQSVAAPKPI
ncbi:hypothetical protein Gohar_013021 [Gossypium harknessii]|uniref:Uncharacterized protein n=1 Tax=Gossypium harknessii TaxID=34285 RepID=A0A7J9GZJ0_9ROSI|nr:hypothetical protein [Gossypium harknessii]